MSKLMNALCLSLCTLTLHPLQGDSIGVLSDQDTSLHLDPVMTSAIDSQEPTSVENQPSSLSDPYTAPTPVFSPTPTQVVAAPKKPKAPFKPFTGKVKGKKVRMRLQPDLESAIVKELTRGEMVLVVDETDDFWTVEPTNDIKAFVFRSFVLDNTIEGNRVNVRMQPSLDSPVLTHLDSGDKVNATPCASNSKWMEISLPSSVHFFVAKNYLENIGPPEVKAKHETAYRIAQELLSEAELFAQGEMKKSFPDIDFEQMTHNFQRVIQESQDFSELTEKAKEALSLLHESYVDKRIAYLETKANEEQMDAKPSEPTELSVTDKMKLWEPIEESLYLTWSTVNENRSIDDYYADQRLTAVRISGIVEPYLAPVKCKPGDYIVRDKDLPVGYIYSTAVNLQNLVGKRVTLVGAPRPNNNFAFPAYFIFSQE